MLFSHELDEPKRTLATHEQIPAQLLDFEVLIARLTRVEESVRAILAQGQARQPTQSGATSRTIGAQEPWQPRAGFGEGFAQDLSQRFYTAAGTQQQDDGGQKQQGAYARPAFVHEGPARHEIHSEADRGSEKLRLDLKLARIDKHLYRDNAPETWHKNVRTYLIGTHGDTVQFSHNLSKYP